jgi:hypothetical protein
MKGENVMKRIALTLFAMTICAQAFSATKSCDELKTEITAKIEAKGVKGFTLEIVSAGEVADKKVVGSCEGGAKKLVYVKAQ